MSVYFFLPNNSGNSDICSRLAAVSEEPWSKWSDNPGVLERVELLGVTQRRGLGDFVSASKQGLLRRLAGSRISTDDHPIVDYLQVANSADAMGW